MDNSRRTFLSLAAFGLAGAATKAGAAAMSAPDIGLQQTRVGLFLNKELSQTTALHSFGDPCPAPGVVDVGNSVADYEAQCAKTADQLCAWGGENCQRAAQPAPGWPEPKQGLDAELTSGARYPFAGLPAVFVNYRTLYDVPQMPDDLRYQAHNWQTSLRNGWDLAHDTVLRYAWKKLMPESCQLVSEERLDAYRDFGAAWQTLPEAERARQACAFPVRLQSRTFSGDSFNFAPRVAAMALYVILNDLSQDLVARLQHSEEQMREFNMPANYRVFACGMPQIHAEKRGPNIEVWGSVLAAGCLSAHPIAQPPHAAGE